MPSVPGKIKHRVTAVLIAVIVAGIGAAGVYRWPDTYEVTARIYVDLSAEAFLESLDFPESSPIPTVKLLRRTLLVRPNLEKIARKTDMDVSAETPRQFEALLIGLAKQIQVSGTDNIYVISYSDTDPKLTTRVVEAILNIMVERSLGESRRDMSRMMEFLDRELAEYESRLVYLDEQGVSASPRTPQKVQAEVYRALYAQLLRKREQLKLIDEARQNAGDRQFNIIDPPRVPVQPIWPPRFLFNILAGLLGVLVGLIYFFTLRPKEI